MWGSDVEGHARLLLFSVQGGFCCSMHSGIGA